MSIYNIIQELGSNNSRLFKEGIVKREEHNELLKKVFLAALDPFTQYHIRKIPEYYPVGDSSLQWALDNLSALSERKVTGHAGINHLRVILCALSKDDAKVIELIIAGDLKCGVSSSTINKVWPGLIKKVPYMRCSLFRDMALRNVDWSKGLFSQEKADGMFCNTDILSDSVKIYSRAGSQFDVSQFSELVKELRENNLPGWQLHGELMVEDDGELLPREIGNGILNSVLKGGQFGLTQYPVLKVWDRIPLTSAVTKGKYEVPYYERFSSLEGDFDGCKLIHLIPTKMVYSLAEAMEHYLEITGQGLEGTILKLREAIWEDGTSPVQWKLKVEFECDLRMKKLNPGNGKNSELFGSIQCESEDGLLVVNVPGRTDEMRKFVFDNWDTLQNGILTAKANSITKPKKDGGKHCLFLPIFIELRLDKKEADSLQRIFDQFESMIMTMSKL